jgi:hypothetical protein
MLEAPTIRPWIISSIKRVLSDEAFTWADWEAQPLDGWDEIEQPSERFVIRASDYPAWSAWMDLRKWLDDGDIRAKDLDYAEGMKSGLQHWLKLIEGNPQ